ncbi:hypothetical protein OG394_30405 [Kribbella sp. NBC_01245]|uniref:hypothetical protein n=1 Tax=Kribbella sp. NBC_01245 TaxID=2903578 RepID=UPI002E27BCF3|nr:hypothetical protein [Kribbella sp. NBC_01245]
MTWPPPTRQDHAQFCETEGWQRVRDARGRTGTHHVTYELTFADGTVARTRISHPVDNSDYGPAIWKHILRDQLKVDEATFWACVQDGKKPDRGGPKIPAEALPADLVHLLITRVGLADSDVAGLSKAEAIARLQQYWSDSP